MIMWTNNQFQTTPVKLSSLTWAIHYGGSAWEGIRSYLGKDGTARLFMLQSHIDRLFESAAILRLRIPYSKEELMIACETLQVRLGNKELYFRPIVYHQKDAENNGSHSNFAGVDIYAFELPNEYKTNGITVTTSAHIRSYPEYEMQCKSSNNYGRMVMWKEEAERLGIDDVLLRDRNGHYTEASTANLFVVLSSGEIVTPPSDGSILPGITRSLVGQQLQAVEKHITRPDLINAQEVFITGTYAEVTPIIEFDGYTIGLGKRGPVVELTQRWYNTIVRNNEWLGTGLD